MPTEPVTHKEIARQGGWSPSTVSQALRNSPRISESTKAAVRQLAARLGYSPDPMLGALAAYRTRRRVAAYHGNLAFLTTWGSPGKWADPRGPSAGSRSFELIYGGAQDRAKQLGYSLEALIVGKGENDGQRIKRLLTARGIKGVVLLPFPELVTEIRVDWSAFAVVQIFSEGSPQRLPNVLSNHFQSMLGVLQRLHERGYRSPGFVAPRLSSEGSKHVWDRTFRSSLEEFPDRGPDPIWIVNGRITEQFPEMKAWIVRNRLDVILYGGDQWMLRFLEQGGILTPRELGLCCLDLLDPDGKVSGIYQNPRQIGAAAVDVVNSLLVANETGPREFPTSTLLAARWIEGETLPSRKDRRVKQLDIAPRCR